MVVGEIEVREVGRKKESARGIGRKRREAAYSELLPTIPRGFKISSPNDVVRIPVLRRCNLLRKRAQRRKKSISKNATQVPLHSNTLRLRRLFHEQKRAIAERFQSSETTAKKEFHMNGCAFAREPVNNQIQCLIINKAENKRTKWYKKLNKL